MTVMDSEMEEAVLGMARTTRGMVQPMFWDRMISSSPWTVTPARMLIRSLPSRAWTIAGEPRIVCAICGLQPRMTMSAARQPATLSFWRILRFGVRWPRVSWTDWTEASRVTQAMKRVGSLWGTEDSGEVGGSAPLGLARELKMPRRMALPRVPDPAVSASKPLEESPEERESR